jgi:tetratricopeptide (TPR) repeat protein
MGHNDHKQQSRETRIGPGIRWLIVIFLVALAYRGVCFREMGGHPLFAEPVIDAGYHHAWAGRIVSGDLWGHGPDDVFKAPLYSYFVAAVYALADRQISVAQWVQLLLGSCSCVLVALAAGRWLGRGGGILAGLIAALYAPYVFFELQLLTPSVSIFLNTAAVVILARTDGPGKHLRWVLVGVLVGLSTGVRPDVILPATLAVGYALLKLRTGTRRRLLGALCLVFGISCVIVPVAVRNYHLTKSIIPVSSNAGINLYVGNVVSRTGTTAVPVGLRWDRLIGSVPQNILEQPAAASRWWVRQTWDHVRENPGSSLGRLSMKTLAFLNAREFRNNICYHFLQAGHWPLRLPFVQFALIVPLGLCGLIGLIWRGEGSQRDAGIVCGIWVLGYWVVGVLFFVNARFRVPATPFLIIPAAWSLVRLADAIGHWRLKSIVGYAVGVALLGAVAWPMWLGPPEADWVRDYVNLGNSLRAKGDSFGAEKAYRDALSVDQDDPDANYLLAVVQLGRSPGSALANLQRAEGLLVDSPDVLIAMAQAHLALGQTAPAMETLKRIPDLASTRNLLPKRAVWAKAHLMLASLEPDSAEYHWERAWAVDPYTAAEFAFTEGRDAPRVLEVFGNRAHRWHWDWYSQANYGMALLRFGDAAQAVEAFGRAIRLAEERDALRFHQARALIKAGERERARQILAELVRSLPDCNLRSDAAALLSDLSSTRDGAE